MKWMILGGIVCVGAIAAILFTMLYMPYTPRPVQASSAPADAPPDAPPTWYVMNSDWTHCFEERPEKSLASRIEELRDSGRNPRTYDGRDAWGYLTVTLTFNETPFTEMEMTYFRNKDGCEAALAKRNAIPDRYR